MKTLAVSTVRKALAEIGFSPCGLDGVPSPETLQMMHCGLSAAQNIAAEWNVPGHDDTRGNIKFLGARWRERSNVHVVSYYGWPRTGAELREIVKGVRETYGKLCGVRFHCGECNGTGIRVEGGDCPECWKEG